MRLIGQVKNKEFANAFSDYLTYLKIQNRIIEEDDETHEIWVIYEDDLERSENLFKEFLASPDDPKYKKVSQKAREIKEQILKEESEEPEYIDARTTIFNRQSSSRWGAITLLLVLASVMITLLSEMGNNLKALAPFMITNFENRVGLPEVMNGEIWRLFTPMFIHFGFLHLLFNMMWLLDLGSMVEDRKGPLFLAIFVIIVSATGNLAQYLFTGPLFGGMSGVIYGLLGYVWMKGKYDPASRLYLHSSTVTFMIIWFLISFTGLLGNIGNASHTAGLVIGVAWGYLTSMKYRMNRNKFKK